MQRGNILAALPNTGAEAPPQTQIADRPTYAVPIVRVANEIALEEHFETPPTTSSERRLQSYRLGLEDMDNAGIGSTIISRMQPGIEGITY